MKTKKMFSKVLAAVLAVLMLVGLMPVFASAAEDDGSNGLYLDKTVTIEPDGTHTIRLEAYATGVVNTKIERTTKPTDIVLVLDQSGSMSSGMDGMPNGIYTLAGSMTNAEAAAESLFYKLGDVYYPVSVKFSKVGTVTGYVDIKENRYTQDKIATTWTDKYNNSHNSDAPYVADSIIRFYRQKEFIGYSYRFDTNGELAASGLSVADARNALREKYPEHTVQFINDDTNGYTAAAYTAVEPVYERTYEYFYIKDDAMYSLGASDYPLTNDSECPYALYKVGVQTGTSRLEVLRYAAKDFVDKVNAEVTDTAKHRVAVVSFGSSAFDRSGGLLDVETNVTTLKDAIQSVPASGATAADYGMQMAKDILNARTADEKANREAIVVFFTDGEPNHNNDFDREVAANAINISKDLKANGKVFSVAVYPGADPAGPASIEGSGATRINDFMHMMSSNFPNALAEKQDALHPWEFFRGAGSMMSGYYMVASNAAALTQVFSTIIESMTTTEALIELDVDSILRDVITDEFILPGDLNNTDNVKVETSAYLGDDKWDTPVPFTNAIVTRNGNTIDVKNFDYTSDENVVVLSGNQGKKLIVTISGIVAKDSAVTGDVVGTNTADSGIWDRAEGEQLIQIDKFEIPTVIINKKSFVLDYAMEADLEVGDVVGSLIGIDDASDKIADKLTSSIAKILAAYGELNLVDAEGSKRVTYKPKTMAWDGYDSFYVFGELKENAYAWSKISVLPANNVYYEDTFVATTEDAAKGGAGIFYNGSWSEDGTAAGNTETPNGPAHGGWIEGVPGLSDDTGYSDGSAHKASTAGATAKFTFTGTGFDIYGRTNGKTGTVLVQVKDTATQISKYMVVDCLAESGDYYQIPTLWFSAPNHGTFEVTITVTAAAGERLEYYLDGIKIYNPMDTTDNTDETVDEAYGEELNAQFASIREFLLDQESFNGEGDTAVAGALFIDRVMVGDTDGDSTANYENALGVYESYGPKNEVYLGSGQKVAFNIGMPNTVIEIGMKAPEGATEASVTYGTADGPVKAVQAIEHSTDLFYKVMSDANGNVVIENSGDKLLSLTKIKLIVNDADEEAEIAAVTVDEMIAVVNEFDALPVMAYSLAAAPAEPEAPVEPETPVEPEQPTEPEEPTVPSGPSVEIENPELPAEPIVPDMELIQEQVKQFVSKLFNAFRGWFGR